MHILATNLCQMSVTILYMCMHSYDLCRMLVCILAANLCEMSIAIHYMCILGGNFSRMSTTILATFMLWVNIHTTFVFIRIMVILWMDAWITFMTIYSMTILSTDIWITFTTILSLSILLIDICQMFKRHTCKYVLLWTSFKRSQMFANQPANVSQRTNSCPGMAYSVQCAAKQMLYQILLVLLECGQSSLS